MKSFLVGLIFILLLLIEPSHSEFYSVAPDKELSGQVKKEQNKILAASPAISKYFKITRDYVECTLTQSRFTPLAYSENRLDGRTSLPSYYSNIILEKRGKSVESHCF